MSTSRTPPKTRRMLRVGARWLSLAVVVLPVLEADARQSPNAPVSRKAPSEWTLDERLADRFEPAAISARAHAHEARVRSIPEASGSGESAATGVPAVINSISGEEEPELFLPWELFDHLIGLGFPPDGEYQDIGRARVQEKAAALGFGADLWPRLEAAAEPLIEFRRDEHLEAMRGAADGNEAPGRYGLTSASTRLCRVRTAALRAAKEEFGAGPFLRLLYEAVAPSISITYTVEQDSADRMRFIEAGCQ